MAEQVAAGGLLGRRGGGEEGGNRIALVSMVCVTCLGVRAVMTPLLRKSRWPIWRCFGGWGASGWFHSTLAGP